MLSDEALAASIQQGDQSAMTTLVNRYYESVLGYIYRMCGANQHLAEDLVQETFLRMIHRIALYDLTRPFKPWLYAIATNIVRNHYNRADTRYTRNTTEDMNLASSDARPEEFIIHKQSQQAVTDALTSLAAHHREVVVLFYYQGIPQKEIADILNIPLGTVKSRLSIGLKRLHHLLVQREVTG